ncbi:MAG: hypothetical protein GC137_04010 [Alphaproteobacteria bacterium]|nr:hypothetical protein [Alphaproteobacteria bacterium]
MNVSENRYFGLGVVACFAAMPILSIYGARALAFVPSLLGIALLFHWIKIQKQDYQLPKEYIVTIILVITLIFLSLMWSVNAGEAAERALKISAILLGGIPLFMVSRAVSLDTLKQHFWLFPVGITVAALIIALDIHLDLAIYKIFHEPKPDNYYKTAVMNRGLIFTTLNIVPTLLCLKLSNLSQKQKVFFAFPMALSMVIALMISQSQTAQLIFILTPITLFFLPYKRKIFFKVFTACLFLCIILTPLIVQGIVAEFLPLTMDVEWLRAGYAGHRLEIWQFIIDYAMQSPIYGYGFEATRYILDFKPTYIFHEGTTVLHPHNFAIQIWIEFGLVGALLCAVLLIRFSWHIFTMPEQIRKHAYAFFILFLVVASISYGLWQSWWIGSIIYFICIFSLMTNKNDARKNGAPSKKQTNID